VPRQELVRDSVRDDRAWENVIWMRMALLKACRTLLVLVVPPCVAPDAIRIRPRPAGKSPGVAPIHVAQGRMWL
jgi:hypothetical protein